MAQAQQRWSTLTEQKPLRTLQRELAEQIVKILRQNPVQANSAEYERIQAAIAHYTLALGEIR